MRKFIEKLYKRTKEIPDPTPIAIPAGFHRPPTLEERMMLFIRSERFKQHMDQSGEETFEEADDFDVGDDFDPSSPYEEHFDHVVNIENLKTEIKQNKAKKSKKFEEEVPKNPPSPNS